MSRPTLTAYKLYFTDLPLSFGAATFDGEIKSTDIGGGAIVDVVPAQAGPTSITLDIAGGKVYWTDNYGSLGVDNIKRADLDGANLETIANTGLQDPSGIAVTTFDRRLHQQLAIWGDLTSNFIRRSDLDGTNDQDVITGLSCTS